MDIDKRAPVVRREMQKRYGERYGCPVGNESCYASLHTTLGTVAHITFLAALFLVQIIKNGQP